MKKLLVLMTVFLSMSLVYAQKSTISVSYGIGSTDNMVYTLGMGTASGFGNAFGADTQLKQDYGVAPIALSYHRSLASNERFSYGGSAIFETVGLSDKNSDDKYGYNAITFAPEAKFKYLNPGNQFNVYGLLGAGVTFLNTNDKSDNEKESFTHFNFQVTPIGIEYGSNVKGFLELGFGYKGLISGGVQFGL